jgi:rubrerythrin
MHHWFLHDLFSTPRGRAYVLTQAAEAESGGEQKIFDTLLEHVHDPELAKMVKKHKEDEERHAVLYGECAARQGARLPTIPHELKVIDTVDEHIARVRGGVRFFDETRHDDRYVMEGYLFLQVLEERAVQQFGVLADALRPFDPRSAAIVLEIDADERRHLRYCHAISKRYAPSQEVLESVLASFRRAEALAYREHTQKSLDFLIREGFVPRGPKALFWRGVKSATVLGELPWTDLGRPAREGLRFRLAA